MACEPKTVKILSLDGGGIRGYFSATFLKRFCQQAGINPSKLYEYFDIICGTSIGGIQAIGYAKGLTPQFMLDFFDEHGQTIFTKSTILPGYQLGVMMGLFGYSDPDDPSGYPATMYERSPLRDAIVEAIGENTLMRDLYGRVIVPSWDFDENKPSLFSNISGIFYVDGEQVFTGLDNNCVDVALSTSAAPIYFPAVKNLDIGEGTGAHNFIDGGVFVNNPVLAGFHSSKILYPSSTRFCVLSVGTGVSKKPLVYEGVTPQNVQYITYLMDNVFIPGVQEYSHNLMKMVSGDVFNDVFYYRFNHVFTSTEDGSLDNADPANLQALSDIANAEYDANALEIAEFIEHLNV